MALETSVSVFAVLMTGICVKTTRKLIETKRREIFETDWNVLFLNWRVLSKYVLTHNIEQQPRFL